jgi:hypothetical protein
MSNPTTVPATTTMIDDWATVWQTVVAGNHVAQKRTKALAVAIIVAYILACIFHATGLGVINIIIGSLAMLGAALYAAKPWVLAAFITGGGVSAISPTIDLGQGIYSGLVTLGRLLNAIMMFIGLVFFLLGTWPLAVPLWMYTILPMATILLINIYIYEKMSSAGWVWKFGATYIFAVLLFGAIGNLPIVKATLGWVNIQSERAAAAIERSTLPGEAPHLNQVIWQEGGFYLLEVGRQDQGVVPAGGIIVQAPVWHCPQVVTAGDIPAVLTPAGPPEEPWDKVLIKPGIGDNRREMTITAIAC